MIRIKFFMKNCQRFRSPHHVQIPLLNTLNTNRLINYQLSNEDLIMLTARIRVFTKGVTVTRCLFSMNEWVVEHLTEGLGLSPLFLANYHLLL